MMKNTIIIVNGCPASGKTTLAKKIIEINPTFNLISYDSIKEEYWDKHGFTCAEEKKLIDEKTLYMFYEQIAYSMKDGKNIITDYPLYQKHKLAIMSAVKSWDYNCICILLYGDKHTIYTRALERDKNNKRHIAHTLNRYIKGVYESDTRIIDDEKSFYRKLEGKNYDLGIGTTIKINIDNVDFTKDIPEEIQTCIDIA